MTTQVHRCGICGSSISAELPLTGETLDSGEVVSAEAADKQWEKWYSLIDAFDKEHKACLYADDYFEDEEDET